jgi:ribonuclease P protein component
VLPAAARLRRSDDFHAVLRRGRRAGRGPLVAHLLLPADGAAPGPARAGFVVGRTVGSAVTRNRLRRQLRHAVRDRLQMLPPGATVVIRALPGAAGLSHHELSAYVDSALARLSAPSGVAR